MKKDLDPTALSAQNGPLVAAVLRGLADYVDTVHDGNRASAKRALGLTSTAFDKWFTGERTPTLKALDPIFQKLNAQVVFPGQSAPSPLPADLASLTAENERLRHELDKAREEQTLLRGEIRGLKEQLREWTGHPVGSLRKSADSA